MKKFKFTRRWLDAARVAAGSKQLNKWEQIGTDKGSNSLGISISYGGTKTWRVRVNDADGKPSYAGLDAVYAPGHPKHLDIEDARKRAKEWKPTPKVVEAEGDGLPHDAVAKVAERWLKEEVEGRKLRAAKRMRRMIERVVLPAWGERSIGGLKPKEDVKALLISTEVAAARSTRARAGGVQAADQLFAVLSSIFNWWSGEVENFIPPTNKKQRRDKRKQKARTRTLDAGQGRKYSDWRELRALWQVTATPTPFNGLVRLLVLTGQRLEKVRTMKHSDISAEDVWTVAVEDAENEKGHGGWLKLPPLALQVIASMPRIDGNPFVFPAVRGRGAVHASSYERKRLEKAFREVLPEAEHFTIHDLRRSARSLMQRAGVEDKIAEKVLGHGEGGIQPVYATYHHDAEKAAALQKLADLVERIVSGTGDNVVPLRRQEAAASAKLQYALPPGAKLDLSGGSLGFAAAPPPPERGH